jgi:HSP20 family protein
MIRRIQDPFGELLGEVNRIQEQFHRVFGDVLPGAGGGPAANVWQDDHAFYAEMDLPGVDPGKLEITVTEGTKLTVKGERPAAEVKEAAWLRQERLVGTFTRALTLPTLVDADKVEAKYEHGVLKLTLPKSEAAKPRKITVRG